MPRPINEICKTPQRYILNLKLQSKIYAITNKEALFLLNNFFATIQRNQREWIGTCWGGPGGVKDAAFLDIGAESNSNLVEIATEDGAGPDGGSIIDGNLAGQHHVRGHVGINSDLREPLPKRYYLPLPSVVPPHAIWRLRDPLRCRRWRRRCCFSSCGEGTLYKETGVGCAQGFPRDSS